MTSSGVVALFPYLSYIYYQSTSWIVTATEITTGVYHSKVRERQAPLPNIMDFYGSINVGEYFDENILKLS